MHRVRSPGENGQNVITGNQNCNPHLWEIEYILCCLFTFYKL